MGTVTTTDVVNGTTADAGVVNANFAAVKAVVNGGIDNSNLSGSAAIDVSKLAPGLASQVLTTVGGVPTWQDPSGGGGSGGTPIGAGMDFWGATLPTGFVWADGSAISRTTYALLFAAIGTQYGSGDGSTTFNVPDKRGRVSVGKGTHADVDTLGDNDGSAIGDRRPKHKHTVTDPGHTHGVPKYGTPGGSGVDGNGSVLESTPATSSATTGITVGPQTNSPSDGPANIVCNYIIYAGV